MANKCRPPAESNKRKQKSVVSEDEKLLLDLFSNIVFESIINQINVNK